VSSKPPIPDIPLISPDQPTVPPALPQVPPLVGEILYRQPTEVQWRPIQMLLEVLIAELERLIALLREDLRGYFTEMIIREITSRLEAIRNELREYLRNYMRNYVDRRIDELRTELFNELLERILELVGGDIANQLVNIQNQINALNNRVTTVEGNLTNINNRLRILEDDLDWLFDLVFEMLGVLNVINSNVNALVSAVNTLTQQTAQMWNHYMFGQRAWVTDFMPGVTTNSGIIVPNEDPPLNMGRLRVTRNGNIVRLVGTVRVTAAASTFTIRNVGGNQWAIVYAIPIAELPLPGFFDCIGPGGAPDYAESSVMGMTTIRALGPAQVHPTSLPARIRVQGHLITLAFPANWPPANQQTHTDWSPGLRAYHIDMTWTQHPDFWNISAFPGTTPLPSTW